MSPIKAWAVSTRDLPTVMALLNRPQWNQPNHPLPASSNRGLRAQHTMHLWQISNKLKTKLEDSICIYSNDHHHRYWNRCHYFHCLHRCGGITISCCPPPSAIANPPSSAISSFVTMTKTTKSRFSFGFHSTSTTMTFVSNTSYSCSFFCWHFLFFFDIDLYTWDKNDKLVQLFEYTWH